MPIGGLDVGLILVWACAVVWGWVSGGIRQIGVLISVYFAAAAAGIFSATLGPYLSGADPFIGGNGNDVVGWAVVFAVVLVVLVVILGRVYPEARVGRERFFDRVAGVVLAAVWGVLLLIAIVTVLRYFTVAVWPGQLSNQQTVATQVQQSLVVHLVVTHLLPLWQLMSAWFPAGVSYNPS